MKSFGHILIVCAILLLIGTFILGKELLTEDLREDAEEKGVSVTFIRSIQWTFLIILLIISVVLGYCGIRITQ